MKNRKLFIYISHIYKMCFLNKYRFFLSVLGLFVGLFVFTIGNIFIDSYYEANIRNALQMDEDTIALSYYSEEKINKYDICVDSSVETLDVVSADTKNMVYAKKYKDDIFCTVSATIMGISEVKSVLPIKYTDEEFLLAQYDLIKGRNINASDIANKNNVVLIDELTESILFPNGNSLGAEITLDVDLPGISDVSTQSGNESKTKLVCTVVGVINNCYYEMNEEMKCKKFISNPRESINLNTVLYLPLSYVEENFELASNKIIAWSTENDEEKDKIRRNLALFKNQSLQGYSSYDIISNEFVIEDAKKELAPLKKFLILIMITLLLISGINAMSTMFFSIKERINEIGIKKALGATTIDILNQFMTEGILMAIISSIVAVVVSIISALFIGEYINEVLFILFDVKITSANVLLPILISVLYGFIFSLIPSYYGAKIKVTESLRFE